MILLPSYPTHPSMPALNVAELVAYAKTSSGKLSYGSAGVGSGHHITGELLKQKTGIDINHVPYRGGGPAIQDLVAGHIQISFGTPPAVLPQSTAGRIRPRCCATFRKRRMPARVSGRFRSSGHFSGSRSSAIA